MDLSTAEEEWAQVAEIVPTFQTGGGGGSGAEGGKGDQMTVTTAIGGRPPQAAGSLETPLIKTETAIEHFRTNMKNIPKVSYFDFFFAVFLLAMLSFVPVELLVTPIRLYARSMDYLTLRIVG